jgi:hypothetical protein
MKQERVEISELKEMITQAVDAKTWLMKM